MKTHISFAHTTISLVLSACILLNTVSVSFAQTRPGRRSSRVPRVSTPPQSRTRSYVAEPDAISSRATSYPQLNRNFAREALGSLTEDQKKRLHEITTMFTPAANGRESKSDFEQFQELYTKQLNEEFQREKQALADAVAQTELKITEQANDYRKEIYTPLVREITNAALNEKKITNKADFSNKVFEALNKLSFNPNKSLDSQISDLTKQYRRSENIVTALNLIAQQTKENSDYLSREKAVLDWKKQAQEKLKSWHKQNLQKLNEWKSSNSRNAKQVFDSQYSSDLLKEREQMVAQAVSDLWLYKDKSYKAKSILLENVALTVLPMQTMDGKSFFTKAQKEWLHKKYLEVLKNGKDCGNSSSTTCNLQLAALIGISMLSNSFDDVAAITTFMHAKERSAYSVPALLTGASALLSMKQYRALNGYIHTATIHERSLEGVDLLSVETYVNIAANTNGQYLGDISKYTQYPLHANPNDQTALGNAWEDLAYLLAEEGSPEALKMLRNYGIEQCRAYIHTKANLKKVIRLSCTGIIPFLAGALASGKSGANQYDLTSHAVPTGYLATNYGNIYIDARRASEERKKLANSNATFKQYYSSMNLSPAAAIARDLFLQSMGDLNAESELRLDTSLYKVYKESASRKTPNAGYAISPYTRGSAEYNAKRARQDRTQIFRKIARWVDVAILVWCVVDLTKWATSGVKIFRAISKASKMARTGATVAQRAMMLRKLNIAPKLRKFISVPTKIKNSVAPVVLPDLPLFTSQTVELPKVAGFIEAPGRVIAQGVRFSGESGLVSAEVASLGESAKAAVAPKKLEAVNTALATASENANIAFANRSWFKRFFTWNENAAYRSYLTREIAKLEPSFRLSHADFADMLYNVKNLRISVPENILTFKNPKLFNMLPGAEGGLLPKTNTRGLKQVMTGAFGKAPTAQEVSYTQGLLNTALENTNVQFANRGWWARLWGLVPGRSTRQYKNLLTDNIAAVFDKEGKIFTDQLQYNLLERLLGTLEYDKYLKAPTGLGTLTAEGIAGRFKLMGKTVLSFKDQTMPQSVPIVFQFKQRKLFGSRGIKGLSNGYQRVIITEKDGKLMFGFGNDLSNPITPQSFKISLTAEDLPDLIRAAQHYSGTPLQIKLTANTSGGMFSRSFYRNRWTAWRQAREDGTMSQLRTLWRGKQNVYAHDIPVQIRLADGTLQTVPLTFKVDSYLGLKNASAVLEQSGKISWFQEGKLLSELPEMRIGLPKNQLRSFLELARSAKLERPFSLTVQGGVNKIQPLMWATGLSLSSASVGLIAPLENVYKDRVDETDKTLISLAFPYLPSLAAPLFSPLVMKIGALRTLKFALGVSTAGLAFAAYEGFRGKLDNNNLPPIWPLYVSGAAIGVSSALSRSGLNLLIDSMGGGGTLLKSMAYKNIGSFALLVPPFVANFIDKDIDFSLAFPVLGTLSAGALTWVSTSRLNPRIGMKEGFMPLSKFSLSRPLTWPKTFATNTWSILKSTGKETWSTIRLLGTKQVFPLVLAATAFTGFEAGAFSKAGNQMIRPEIKGSDMPGFIPETNRNNYTSMLTNLSVIAFPLFTRLLAKPSLNLLKTAKAGDEYRRMLGLSFALNATGAGLLYANSSDGLTATGMLGIGLMGIGTANMTQSFQKLSNISVTGSRYASILSKGKTGEELISLNKSLVTKTMTGFPMQQLGIAIVPTLVSSYTDQQIDQGTIRKKEAAHSSLWLPITSLALCFGLSMPALRLLPTSVPRGTFGLTKGLIGSYPGAVNQFLTPQFYIEEPIFGVPSHFSPIPTNPILKISEIIPSRDVMEKREKELKNEENPDGNK